MYRVDAADLCCHIESDHAMQFAAVKPNLNLMAPTTCSCQQREHATLSEADGPRHATREGCRQIRPESAAGAYSDLCSVALDGLDDSGC